MNVYLRRAFNFLLHLAIFILLTILSQIGGLVYLLYLFIWKKWNVSKYLKSGIFLVTYTLLSLIIIPQIAPLFGRVALPLTGIMKPRNFGTCLLNRHYVTPELWQVVKKSSNLLSTKYPGTTINYLDANFPFVDGFPLIPHLSHNDGKKIDIAFLYVESRNNERVNTTPSFIGYGVYASPKSNEIDYPTICAQEGNWQYSFIHKFVPQWNSSKYIVDSERTSDYISLLSSNLMTSKIFIEPHLKSRWKLSKDSKIRFHGCHAVRHDDHIHLQIK
ncbi:MAG: hypothetical protein NXI20_27045 [bacterium]|nr:hypothetical protein [bacterium]